MALRSQAVLRDDFRAICLWRPFDPRPRMGEGGLTLGRGTLLARCLPNGVQGDLGGVDADRLLALLSAVYGRPVDPTIVKCAARATARWHAGEHAMAQFDLAFARLPPLESDADAFRLFVAEALIGDGMAPRVLLRALGFVHLAKYDRNQPRVPAGNGRASGEFGSASGALAAEAFVPVPAARGLSLLGEIGPEILTGLTTFALRFAAPTAVLGALFIPTPNGGGVTEGVLPDAPGVRFRRDGPAGTLRLTATAANGEDVVVGAQSRRGVYVDIATGTPVGRDLGERLYLDADAVDGALYTALAARGETEPAVFFKPRDDGPKVCPAPTPDVPHKPKEHILDYEDDVHRRVNPDAPLPRGFAVRVVDPLTGRAQYPDDCFRTSGDVIDGDMKTGDFAEGKAWEFERMLNDPKIGHLVLEKLVNTAKKYVRSIASSGARLKYYVAEAGAADIVRNEFAKIKELKYTVTLVFFRRAGPSDERRTAAGPIRRACRLGASARSARRFGASVDCVDRTLERARSGSA